MAITHTYEIDGKTYTSDLTPVKAIRKNCLACSGGSAVEVKECPMNTCPLYPFRFGKSPGRKPMSEERRKEASKRFKKMWAEKETK